MTDAVREVLAGERRWAVLHADCLDVLPTLPAGSVDNVISDPPFSERTHDGARGSVRTGRSAHKGFADGEGTRRLIDFDSISADDFVGVVGEMVRVARRWVVITCDWRHAAVAESSGLPVVRCGVWVKPDAAPQFTGDRPGTGWEAVLLLHRPGRKRWNGGGHHAVWTHPRDRSRLHPAVKPLTLIREWVELFTDPGEVILDPFAGSGTTGVACLQTGRRFLGVEISPEYAALAEARLRKAEQEVASEAAFFGGAASAGLFGEE
jgi:site-specific DNA-methyltransferase (adenine-specific)